MQASSLAFPAPPPPQSPGSLPTSSSAQPLSCSLALGHRPPLQNDCPGPGMHLAFCAVARPSCPGGPQGPPSHQRGSIRGADRPGLPPMSCPKVEGTRSRVCGLDLGRSFSGESRRPATHPPEGHLCAGSSRPADREARRGVQSPGGRGAGGRSAPDTALEPLLRRAGLGRAPGGRGPLGATCLFPPKTSGPAAPPSSLPPPGPRRSSSRPSWVLPVGLLSPLPTC